MNISRHLISIDIAHFHWLSFIHFPPVLFCPNWHLLALVLLIFNTIQLSPIYSFMTIHQNIKGFLTKPVWKEMATFPHNIRSETCALFCASWHLFFEKWKTKEIRSRKLHFLYKPDLKSLHHLIAANSKRWRASSLGSPVWLLAVIREVKWTPVN